MNVYLIEDDPQRLKMLVALIKALNRLDDGETWQNGFGTNSKEECLSFEGIQKALDDSNAIILLDVDLDLDEDAQNERIECIRTQYQQHLKKANIFKNDHLEDLDLRGRHRLAVSIFAFALAKGRKVVVTSGVGLAMTSSEKLGVPTGLFPEPGARRADNQLETLAKIIIGAVSGYHSDEWVTEYIKQWINGYRALKSDGHLFCDHNHLQNPSESERYGALIGRMCGLPDSLMDVDTTGRKALLQLNAVPADNVEPVDWFIPWMENRPTPKSKPISNHSMVTLLQAASGHNHVVIDIQTSGGETSPQVYLPVFPALSFVAGLRILFQELREQGAGILGSAEMRLTGRGGLYQLSIPLTPDNEEIFGLSRQWVEKCESGGAQIASNGVCAALWNLSQAKVNGIKKTVARSAIERALLSVFQGPSRTVAAVGFGPHHIELYWRAIA